MSQILSSVDVKVSDDSRLRFLKKEVRRHKKLYYVDSNPEISDAEYDELEEELRQIDPKAEELTLTGSDFISYDKTVKHVRVMGSLSKVKTIEDFEKWWDGQ